jgi:hypothetical protein
MRCAPVSGAIRAGDVAKTSPDFVPLSSLTRRVTSPRAVLGEIRRIYFKTTRQTIEHDVAHAIALLKQLEREDDREKATVYMQGLTEMRRDWAKSVTRGKAKTKTKNK